MRLYNCVVNLVDQAGHMKTQVLKESVTAAEIIVFRDIHGPTNVIKIQPIGQDKRPHGPERQRLAEKYNRPVKDGEQMRIDRLFGPSHVKLPVELPEVQAPDEPEEVAA